MMPLSLNFAVLPARASVARRTVDSSLVVVAAAGRSGLSWSNGTEKLARSQLVRAGLDWTSTYPLH
jgi:hypothetical protein